MAVIRTYPVGEAVARPAPDVAYQPIAIPASRDIENFAGGAQAKDLQVASAYMAKASDSLGQIAIREAEQVNEAYVQDLNNQFIKSQQEMLYTGQDAFYRKQGKAALDAAPAATEQLQALQKAMIDQTKNEWQKVRLTRILNGHINEVTNGMSRFVAAQSMEWEKQVKENRIELAASASRTQFNDEPFLNNQVASVTSTLTAGTGWEPGSDEYKGAEMKARSIVYGQAIDGALDRNQNAYAIQLFDKHKDKLDARTQDRIGKAIETARINDTATSQGRLLMDQSYDARTRGYESGKMEFNKLGSGAYGPFQFMPGTWADVRANHPELDLPADMTKATEAQHIAANKAFKTDNAAEIQKAGFPLTAANLYLAHRFGAGGAVAVLRANPDTPLSNILPANWQAQNSDMKGQTAGSFRSLAEQRYAGVTDLGIDQAALPPAPGVKGDPLRSGVDQATGVQRPQNGSMYKDPRQLLLDADAAHDAATLRNNEVNADNDNQRRATQSVLDRNLAQRKQQIETERLRLEADLNNWMVAGQTGVGATQRPPPEIWNRLSYQQQQAVDSTIKHNVAGTQAVTNWQVYDAFRRGLTDEDATVREKWANEPLWKIKPYLADADYKHIAGMQDAVRKGDPDGKMSRMRSISQIVDDEGLKKLGIKPNPEPSTSKSSDAWKASRFRNAVQEEITSLEVSQGGKKATDEQVRGIVKRLAAKSGASWFSSGTAEYEKPIYDVPMAERQKIRDAFKRRGVTDVTDEDIVKAYTLKGTQK